MAAIPLKAVSVALRKYTEVQNALEGIDITIEPESYWSSQSEIAWRFMPRYDNVRNENDIARICEITNWYIPDRGLNPNSQEDRRRLSIQGRPDTCAVLNGKQTGVLQSPVKYYYDTRTFGTFGFPSIVPLLITGTPTEHNIAGRTVRFITGEAPISYGESVSRDTNGSQTMAFAVSTESPLYNYLDRGHIVFFVATSSGPEIFVTNQVSLAVYHFAAIFSVNAERLKPLLRNNTFLFAQNPAELQRVIGAAERMVPEKYRESYLKLKQAIRTDFEKNAQNVLVTKFQRGETQEITLNNIKFSANRATYETITLEAQDLCASLLNRVDTNSVFDIYQLIEQYITGVVAEMDASPKNNGGQGFAEARTWEFSINGMPIRMSVSTTNTRRRVNGHLINNDELVRVVRRASCYTDANSYDKFLRQVELASLRVHDALANGVPIKILDSGRRSYGHSQPTTTKHPKIFFVQEKNTYYLWLNKAKTEKVPLRRFVGLLDAIKRINAKTDGYYAHDGVGTTGRRDAGWCKVKLGNALKEHAVNAEGTCLITDEQLNVLTDWLLEARTEAERKSKELLDNVVKETDAKPVEYKGIAAFEVTGHSGRSYTVEKESFKVWDTKSGDYVCIVDGRGEMGVGYDALVARLLALKNDSRVVDKIGTLSAPIRRHAVEASQPAPANA